MGERHARCLRWRIASILFVAAAVLVASGCASLPPPRDQVVSHAIHDVERTPLASLVAPQTPTDGRSAFLLQPYGPNAFATRLALAGLAARSLDVQYYLLRADNTGLTLMRALRDAAVRGVRVRVLVDDFYTAGEDDVLTALAQVPNVEVRLFNPFPAGRNQTWTRFVASALDFPRVNRRMHNKLFVADNVAAVTGGRNMADEYVMNAEGANFIDMDVFAVGPVVRDLSEEFDHYWNSAVVYDVRSIVGPVTSATSARLQDEFEQRSRAARPPTAADVPLDGRIADREAGRTIQLDADVVTMLDLPFAIARGRLGPLLPARARVLYDPLTKTAGWNESQDSLAGTVTEGVVQWLASARHRIKLVSPYFIPSEASVARLAAAKEHGVDVTVITNSLASTDEPFVYYAYRRRVGELIDAGVRVAELSPRWSAQRHRLGLFGHRRGALHMKNAVVDDREVFLGSMNLDPRSAKLNTELGLVIESPELAEQLDGFADAGSWYRLRRAPDRTIEWVRDDGQGSETVYHQPPETTAWERWKLHLLGPFVPEKDL